jgi:uncharacterized protein (UPF0335 family)
MKRFVVCSVTNRHVSSLWSVNSLNSCGYHVSAVALQHPFNTSSSAFFDKAPTKHQIGRFLNYFNLERSSSNNEVEQLNLLKSLSSMFRGNIQFISAAEHEDEDRKGDSTSNSGNTQDSNNRINEILKKLDELESHYLTLRLSAFQAIRYHNYIDSTVSLRYPTIAVESFLYCALLGGYLFDSSLSEFWRNCLGGAAAGYTISLAYDAYAVTKVKRWRKLLIDLGEDEKEFYQEKHTELIKDVAEIKTLLSLEKKEQKEKKEKNQMIETLIFSKFHEKIEKQVLEICDGIDEFCKSVEQVIMNAENMKDKETVNQSKDKQN